MVWCPYMAKWHKMYRDGMKVLWCCSHLVCLIFEGSIPTCACFVQKTFCDMFLLFFLSGIVREKRGGRGGRGEMHGL